MPKTQRNAPCPCGSGRKQKHCCGKIAGAEEVARARNLRCEMELAGKAIAWITRKYGEHSILEDWGEFSLGLLQLDRDLTLLGGQGQHLSQRPFRGGAGASRLAKGDDQDQRHHHQDNGQSHAHPVCKRHLDAKSRLQVGSCHRIRRRPDDGSDPADRGGIRHAQEEDG